MARLYCLVFDEDYDSQLTGPIPLLSADVERVFDGIDKCKIEIPVTDTDAIAAISNERVIEVYIDEIRQAAPIRLFGAFVVKNHNFNHGSSGKKFVVDGPGTLEILKREITHPGQIYSITTRKGIIEDNLPNGWAVATSDFDFGFDGAKYRFDGQNSYQVLRQVTLEADLHYRVADNPDFPKTITVDELGDDSGLRIVSFEGSDREIINNGNVVLRSAIDIESESSDIANALLPISGDGDTYIDLSQSNRAGITSRLGKNGKTNYWIEDATSIATWGRHERYVDASKLKPISNSSADILSVANAMYDASYAELQRTKDPVITYGVDIEKVDSGIRPGDKIHLEYTGTVFKRTDSGGVVATQKSVKGDFWIMRVRENVGNNGNSVRLSISNVDREPKGAGGLVVGAIETTQLQGMVPKIYSTVNSDRIVRPIDSSNNADFEINITAATNDLQRCILRVDTRPFIATATSAQSVTSASGGSAAVSSAAGGDHDHVMFRYSATPSSETYSDKYYFCKDSGSNPTGVEIHSTPGTDPLRTEESSGDHTHTVNIPSHTHTIPAASLVYGLQQDSSTPDGLSLWINGANQTSLIKDTISDSYGPWAVGGGNTTLEFEISDILKSGTLQQQHTISFRCASGQGEIEVQIERYETIQNIAIAAA